MESKTAYFYDLYTGELRERKGVVKPELGRFEVPDHTRARRFHDKKIYRVSDREGKFYNRNCWLVEPDKNKATDILLRGDVEIDVDDITRKEKFIKQANYLKPARDYFFQKCRRYNSTHYHRKTLMETNTWNSICSLIYMSYGVHGAAYLPDDKKEEVNDLGIRLIDILYTNLLKVAKSDEKELKNEY